MGGRSWVVVIALLVRSCNPNFLCGRPASSVAFILDVPQDRKTGGHRYNYDTPSSCRCRSLSLLLAAERARRGLLKPLGVTRAVSLDTIACS